jgi:hypothetical protein
MTKRIGWSRSSPRSRRSVRSAGQTVAFSVVPSRRARTCFGPCPSTPTASRTTWSRMWRPSMMRARISSSASRRVSQGASGALVSATKPRDTLRFETARSPRPAGRGSSARRYLRVVTPLAAAPPGGAGVEGIAVGGVGEAREGTRLAVDPAGPQARHENAAPAERDFARRLTVAVRAAIGMGDFLRPAQPLPILFHHRAQPLLAGFEAEPKARGARGGEHVEQGQRDLPRGDGWGRERFPGARSYASLVHGGSFRKVVVTAVLSWTAKGVAALSRAGQFNRRRDITRMGAGVSYREAQDFDAGAEESVPRIE